MELSLENDGTDCRITFSEILIPRSSPETAQGAKRRSFVAPTALPSPKTQRTSGAKLQNFEFSLDALLPPSSSLLTTAAQIVKTATRGRRQRRCSPREHGASLGCPQPPGGLDHSLSRSRVQPRGGARSDTGQAPGRAGEPLPER